MAKKKKRKENKKQKTGYSVELIGFLLIMIAIIGWIPKTGIIGHFISSFAIFLAGPFDFIFLISLVIIGIYMIIKREKPDFFNPRLIGLYIFLIGLFVCSHMEYVEDKNLVGAKIVTETISNFFKAISDMSTKANLGGGIIGALFSWLFVSLLDINGTRIAFITLMVCGFVLFSGISIFDIVKKMGEKASTTKERRKEQINKEAIKEKEKAYENDNKVVVSSIDQLIRVDEEVKDEIKEEVIPNNIEEMNTKGYVLPPISLLAKPVKNKSMESKETINHNVEVLQQVLKDFGVEGHVVAINPGPTVTQYEMEIKSGTKVSKVASLNKEIALALAARDVRIEAPIPGKSTIGVEIPNKVKSSVTIREILEKVPSSYDDAKLLVTLGKNIMGKPVYAEINKTPHLLVAGSTGSGKSVCINSIIVSILMRTKPDEVKLVLVDPKKVELSMYNGIPHLLAPVVTDPRKANIALKKIVSEMERRYDIFSDSKTKNIAGYNAYVDKENEKRSEEDKLRHLPFIVVIIDELADLMLVAAKEVEDSIMRITQMARAAGIHLIVATQRPSADVITGVIKANIPSRIAFAVASNIDSRTILDSSGAEKLLGKGDMLFLPQGENTPIRIQGTFLSDEEIKSVVDYTIKQQIAKYDETLTMDDEEMHATTMVDNMDNRDATEEPLYNEIVEFVVTQGKASASLLQRRFRLGYNRAARCIDLLEERGIIGPNNGSKPREVLVKLEKDEDN
ncbi:MAG: cell division protein FtsK [Bacilli bacterium]|nr:cell division protein FtsK [Bacilli bacterium]